MAAKINWHRYGTKLRHCHLKCVATLPCNLSLIALFYDINVSQGSVATCARFWVTHNTSLLQIHWRILQRKNFENRFRFHRSMACSVLAHMGWRTRFVVHSVTEYWHVCVYELHSFVKTLLVRTFKYFSSVLSRTFTIPFA